MIDIDPKTIEDIIRHVAETVVRPRFQNLQQSEIREKNPDDFVTIADEESEKMLTQMLEEALPGSLVVGEEAVSKDRSVLYRLAQQDPVWVVDPIDGTYNFLHGRSRFGILVSLIQGGKTLYGWAYDVPGNRMAFAKRGGGAYLDGQKFTVACDKSELADMTGMGGGAQAWHFKSATKYFKEIINLRCALYDFMTFFTGEADFIVHVNRTTPWDHSAGCLIAEEAGAYIALDENYPYDPTLLSPKTFLLIAPSQAWWEKLYPVLKKNLGRKSV